MKSPHHLAPVEDRDRLSRQYPLGKEEQPASAQCLRQPASFLAVLGLTGACWGADLPVMLTSFASVHLPPIFVVGVMCLLGVNLGNLFQVTPANVGPLEAAAMLALAALGIRGPEALAFAILYHLVWVVPQTLAGLEGLRLVAEARRAQQQTGAI